MLFRSEVFLDAVSRIETGNIDKSASIILSSPAWHEGVSGIVASRLIERYYRPTLLFKESNGILKGSGRSVAGVDLFAVLSGCRELLISFGGHKAAAGVRLKKENLKKFRERFNSVLAELSGGDRSEEHTSELQSH